MRTALILIATLVFSATATAAGSGPEIREAWIRWLPAGVPMAGYFTVTNTTSQTMNLTGAASEAFGKASLHEAVKRDDGSTRMRPIDLPLTIQPGQTISFEPGGYHLMLMQPRRELRPGDSVRITLRQESGPAATAVFSVRSATGE